MTPFSLCEHQSEQPHFLSLRGRRVPAKAIFQNKRIVPRPRIHCHINLIGHSAYSREEMQLDIHELINPQHRKPIGDCSLNFPHQCELTDGEMKGSWEAVKGNRADEPPQTKTHA